MPPTLSSEQLRAARQRAQMLAGHQPQTVRDAVARLGAVQAQLPSAARLALRVRTAGTTAADVDAAVADRSVVCTWTLRGTLHLVAATDVHWMVDLLGPLNAAGRRRRRDSLGLDPATCERGIAAITEVLLDAEPLTRAELITRIAEHGVTVDPNTQAPAHLVAYAANSGVLCRGPDRGGDATYVLLDQWIPRSSRLGREDALAELARRYLAAHAPASVADLRAWSGLPAADARRAFELVQDELVTVGTEIGPILSPASMRLDGAGTAPTPPRLLGHFDPLLLGYRSRALLLDPEHAKAIQAGGGFIRPAVLVEGRVQGTWQLDRAGSAASITIEPFHPLPRTSTAGLEAEAADIGRFLDRTARLGRPAQVPGAGVDTAGVSRPYVVLSCAMSRDGYLDDASPQRLILSNLADLHRVDGERAKADGILVGANTVRRDDPRLLVRDPAQRRDGAPVKVCLTTRGALDPAARFFIDGDVAKIVYCPALRAASLRDAFPAATVVGIDTGTGTVDLGAVLDDLATRGVRRLLVEGGASVLGQFVAGGLADEFQLVVSPVLVGDKRAPRLVHTGSSHPRFDGLELTEEHPIEQVVLLVYRQRNRAVAVGSEG